MKKYASYPFYKSIRFRFGLLFNFLLLLFLSAIIFLLYANVKRSLDKNFLLRLQTGAYNILQKTEVNPTVVPLSQSDEKFLLTYNNTLRVDTLFNNLPVKNIVVTKDSLYKDESRWFLLNSKTLETGGVINVWYALPANDYNNSIQQLQTLLFIYIPVAILISFVAGFFLSGIFIKPLKNIIIKANETDLTNDIKLLDEPLMKDELHELVDALNRMLLRIEKQSLQQNAFFASASHELRTPLSNMLTELQTIDTSNALPSVQTLVQNQIAEVHRLTKLVNNFLLMSQLKAESVVVNTSSFSIAELCVEIIELLQTSASQNKQTFKIDISPADADFIMQADKSHVLIILNNLLGNAIKYGLHHHVINVNIIKDNSSIKLIIENKTDVVIDNISLLKNHFQRADFYKEGFGLGLWIADELIKKNDGKLKLNYQNKLFTAEISLAYN